MNTDGYDYDCFVIGGGSGVRSSRIATQLGARVGLCEVDRLGGTCVNLGCCRRNDGLRIGVWKHRKRERGLWLDALEGQFDWARLIANKTGISTPQWDL